MVAIDINVDFDVKTKKLSLSGPTVKTCGDRVSLHKSPSITRYCFKLANASFLTDPLQWFSSSTLEPIPMPFSGRLIRLDNQTAVLEMDLKPPPGSTEEEGFGFHILVMYEGAVYWHDPVLLNEPDDGGGAQ